MRGKPRASVGGQRVGQHQRVQKACLRGIVVRPTIGQAWHS